MEAKMNTITVSKQGVFKNPQCVFNVAWVGRCKNEAEDGSVVCEKHSKQKCWCGAQATRECSHASSLVCGAPLCADHRCKSHG